MKAKNLIFAIACLIYALPAMAQLPYQLGFYTKHKFVYESPYREFMTNTTRISIEEVALDTNWLPYAKMANFYDNNNIATLLQYEKWDSTKADYYTIYQYTQNYTKSTFHPFMATSRLVAYDSSGIRSKHYVESYSNGSGKIKFGFADTILNPYSVSIIRDSILFSPGYTQMLMRYKSEFSPINYYAQTQYYYNSVNLPDSVCFRLKGSGTPPQQNKYGAPAACGYLSCQTKQTILFTGFASIN